MHEGSISMNEIRERVNEMKIEPPSPPLENETFAGHSQYTILDYVPIEY